MLKFYKLLFIISFFILSFFLRLVLSASNETRVIFDMETNKNHALELIRCEIPTDCCIKNIGYSLFLSGIYLIFGPDNLQAVRIIQIILDLLTAVLIYFIVKRIVNQKVGLISMVMYLINPFSSSFTGLQLAEVLTIHLVVLTAYILSLPSWQDKFFIWWLGGLLLGLTAFVRHQFFHFSVIWLILVFLIWGKHKFRKLFIILTISGYLLGIIYVPIANYINYGKFKFVPVYNGAWGVGLYTNFHRDYRWGEIQSDLNDKPNPIAWQIFAEYYYAEKEGRLSDILEYEKKYRHLFFETLPIKWNIYLINTLRNIIWLWDKDHISEYIDIYYPKDRIPLRIYNSICLGLFFVGIIHFGIKHSRKIFYQPVWIFSIVLFFYMTGLFSMISNISRQTLAFYGLIMLWAGYGLSIIIDVAEKLIINIKRNIYIS